VFIKELVLFHFCFKNVFAF
jgi:ankyrin repeat protein